MVNIEEGREFPCSHRTWQSKRHTHGSSYKSLEGMLCCSESEWLFSIREPLKKEFLCSNSREHYENCSWTFSDTKGCVLQQITALLGKCYNTESTIAANITIND